MQSLFGIIYSKKYSSPPPPWRLNGGPLIAVFGQFNNNHAQDSEEQTDDSSQQVPDLQRL